MNTSRRPRLRQEKPQPTGLAAIFESEERRLALFTRLLAVSVLLCLAMSWKLWISRQFYPFVPFLDLVPAFPYPFDWFALGLFVALLLAVVIQPRSRIGVALVLAIFVILFLQDQSRQWPSFYQFFFLFLILVTYRSRAGASDAHRVLAGMRFILAAIYFWSGVQKLNPHFFNEEFPWLLEPLTGLLPFNLPFLPALGILAAVVEVLIGIGLLTNRFRNVALYDAMLMHLLIFFCIGPFRGNWNNSSWMWSLTTAVQVWVLFYKAPAFDFKTMFGAPSFYNIPQALAVVFIGILPVLNNVNRWDSALSFNVYTGNVSYAEIHMRPEVVSQLPSELLPFVRVQPDRAVLNLNAWTLDEFNANPYPETRIFKAVLRKVCSYLPADAAVLYVEEKAGWFFAKTTRRYGCDE
ncbi:MAG: hypothetical protein WD851_02590 [Pirellulales bacterium]